jgi:hypothetical protein
VYDASCCEVVYRTVVRGLRCLLLRGYLLLCNVYTTVVSSATTCTAVRWVLYCTSYVPRVLYILLLGYLFLCEAPEDQRQETSSYSTRSFQIPTRRLEATAVGVSGSWFLRRETSKYSTRSLQITTRRLEATAVGISGSWLLRRETSSYSTGSLQVPVRRLEATAVGVSGSWFLRQETRSYSGRNLRFLVPAAVAQDLQQKESQGSPTGRPQHC